jgi:tRNA1Val (adenine37-N6)-methyltransferase
VSKAHTFGADAVLLSHFSAPVNGMRLCDLGTGCGIIPLLWCRNAGPFVIDAFELQEPAADMARRAADLNGLGINIYNADLRHIDTSFNNRYDLVTCNPPYMRAGAANVSRDAAAALARHEVGSTLADVVAAAARLLKPKGRFCLCHRPERLTDVFALMRASDLEPKRMRLVQQNKAARPWLVLIEGRSGGRPGIEVEPALLAEENGEVSAEMRLIYGDYQK